MAGSAIRFDGLNLICRDPAATIAFYRLLGVEFPEDKFWATSSGVHHVGNIEAGDGPAGLEFDSTQLAEVYNAAFRARPAGTLIGFRLESREAVDGLVDRVKAAGYECRQEPIDAFWGARFAILCDPDGRDVGLQSPRDATRTAPPPAL